MVLLPEPLRPVNQSVAPFCFSRPARSSRVAWPSCQVMLVALISLMLTDLLPSTPGCETIVLSPGNGFIQGLAAELYEIRAARPFPRPYPLARTARKLRLPRTLGLMRRFPTADNQGLDGPKTRGFSAAKQGVRIKGDPSDGPANMAKVPLRGAGLDRPGLGPATGGAACRGGQCGHGDHHPGNQPTGAAVRHRQILDRRRGREGS